MTLCRAITVWWWFLLIQSQSVVVVSGEQISFLNGRYVAYTDVADRAAISRDVEAIRNATSIEEARDIYTNGLNSIRKNGRKKKKRSLMELSTSGEKTMMLNPEYVLFHHALTKTKKGSTKYADANYADVHIQHYIDEGQYEYAASSAVSLTLWMYVVHELRDAYRDCMSGNLRANDGRVHALDEAFAYYVGEDQTENSADGNSIYSLAQEMGTEFQTLNEENGGEAFANEAIIEFFNMAQEALLDKESDFGSCLEVRKHVNQIVGQMTIPLVQKLLHHLVNEHHHAIREYALALVPLIEGCNEVYFNDLYDLLITNFESYKYDLHFDGVRSMLEKVYSCLEIGCEDVGIIPDPNSNDQPCVAPTETSSIVGYEPISDVTQHLALDTDILQIKIFLESEAYVLVDDIYRYGRNSWMSSNGYRRLYVLATTKKRRVVPYYEDFGTYFDGPNYAHDIIMRAISKTHEFENASSKQITEIVHKTLQYMVVYMHILYELYHSVEVCKKNEDAPMDDDDLNFVNGIDAAWAFVVGSIEGEEIGGIDHGQGLYALAKKRCEDFMLCGGSDHSVINEHLLSLFQSAQNHLLTDKCDKLEEDIFAIEPLLLAPLVQSALRFAAMEERVGPRGKLDYGHIAEGYVYSRSHLPMIKEADPKAATIIEKNLNFATSAAVDDGPVQDGADLIFDAYANAMHEMGIDCEIVGRHQVFGDLCFDEALEGEVGGGGEEEVGEDLDYYDDDYYYEDEIMNGIDLPFFTEIPGLTAGETSNASATVPPPEAINAENANNDLPPTAVATATVPPPEGGTIIAGNAGNANNDQPPTADATATVPPPKGGIGAEAEDEDYYYDDEYYYEDGPTGTLGTESATATVPPPDGGATVPPPETLVTVPPPVPVSVTTLATSSNSALSTTPVETTSTVTSYDPNESTTLAGGLYIASTNVKDRAMLALDQEDIMSALLEENVDEAKRIYEQGQNSKKFDENGEFNGKFRSFKEMSTNAKSKMHQDTTFNIFTYALQDEEGLFMGKEVGLYADTYTQALFNYGNAAVLASESVVVLHLWMYVNHKLDDVLNDCRNAQFVSNHDIALRDNENGVLAIDEVAAYFIGVDQNMIDAGGPLLYALAETAAELFGTLKEGNSVVNLNIISLLNEAKDLLKQKDSCTGGSKYQELRIIINEIKAQMTIPLIQSLIRHLQVNDIKRVKLYGLAILPLLAGCNPNVFDYLMKNLVIMDYNPRNDKKQNLENIILNLESTYTCLNIKCEDVGTFSGQHSFCKDPGPITNIAGYQPLTNVAEHAKIDLDILHINIFMSMNATAAAKDVYMNGRNSMVSSGTNNKKKTHYRTLQSLATSTNREIVPQYSLFRTYFHDPNYADTTIMKILNNEKSSKFYSASLEQKTQALVGTLQYQIMYMAMLQNLYQSHDNCQSSDPIRNAGSVKAWDVAVAYFVGSIEGTEISGSHHLENGELLYTLHKIRCPQFDTCMKTAHGDTLDEAIVNNQLMLELTLGQEDSERAKCDILKNKIKIMEPLFTIGLIQSVLRHALLNKHINVGSNSGNLASGDIMYNSIAPLIANVNANSNDVVQKNLEFQLEHKPIVDGSLAVFDAMSKVLHGMNLKCDDIGTIHGMDVCSGEEGGDGMTTRSSNANASDGTLGKKSSSIAFVISVFTVVVFAALL